MERVSTIKIPDQWIQALELEPRVGHGVLVETNHDSPYASVLEDIFNLGVSAVHCVEGVPSAVILHDEHNDLIMVDRVHQSLWNQGLADFLFIVRDDAITIHTLWESTPNLEEKTTDTRLLDCLHLVNQADSIATLIPRIESGRLFADYSKKLNSESKVDARLIRDLAAYREILVKSDGISKNEAHEALLQAMFLRYLWDRQIISSEHTQHYSHGTYNTLHDLLVGSESGWYDFLSFLSKAFNGSMLHPNDSVWSKGKKTLSLFLQGEFDPITRQRLLLQLYQFDHIPVELISEVYDRFLEGGDEKGTAGAYYTPRRLANLVVDQAWPKIEAFLNNNSSFRILDPTCGSGVFLVSIFQRISAYLRSQSTAVDWDDLKQFASCLHGTDINPTAVRIAAFSLALAMLNERQPKEIEARLSEDAPLLPPLINNSIRKKNFFKLADSEKYQIVIGNPPWGQTKGDERQPGEVWCSSDKQYRQPPNREKSWPFLWKSSLHLAEEGQLHLLLPMKGCVLNKDADVCLDILANTLRIESFFDLSDLRNILFSKAKVPACILNGTQVNEKGISHFYEHICPKADYHSSQSGRILLAPEDRHSTWVSELINTPRLTCKRLMWGLHKEAQILSQLQRMPKTSDFLRETDQARKEAENDTPEWGVGLGVQFYNKSGKKEVKVPGIENKMHLVSSKALIRLAQPTISTEYPGTPIQWKNFYEAFEAPHIVVVPSTPANSGYRLRATYSEQPFSYTKSMIGVAVPDTSAGREFGKILTALLNSSLIGWYLFYTTDVGTDRERISQSSTFLLSLPFPAYCSFKDSDSALAAHGSIIQVMDEIIGSNRPPTSAQEAILDDLVFKLFHIRSEDAALIKEFVKEVRPSMHPGSIKSPVLWDSVRKEERDNYCEMLSLMLSKKMKGDRRFYSHVLHSSPKYALVRISRKSKESKEQPDTINAWGELLGSDSLNGLLFKALRHNVYIERAVFFFLGDDAYLLKPMQRRFWLTRSAYRDADRFIDYLLSPDAEESNYPQ
ncbi:putative N-6 DNA methylase [Pseudodesulfovibrio profundus]|uniref:site-specific DNA-methyltransferase (adenine-specific) n=1 Tax=Pseudodesulfovibrio profundus TaxID=57320 RepID=A0A2C8FB38_9BACT|nr:N-6 DNA methylase [Pseudodesulfovibrio profundus]SOB59856.1 putative N-6 DNA methylase [Pseudodesulfovibrio profundus]